MIYYKLFITNKWAWNVLNWNHFFIWKAKTRYFTNISNLQQKWEQNSSPITWAEYDCRDGKGEKHKSFSQREAVT